MRIIEKAYTFDDVLLVPAHSQVLPRDVSLKTPLTKKITLNLPLLSAQHLLALSCVVAELAEALIAEVVRKALAL